MYKYCITYRQHCKKAMKNGMCKNKDKRNCLESKAFDKLMISRINYNYY